MSERDPYDLPADFKPDVLAKSIFPTFPVNVAMPSGTAVPAPPSAGAAPPGANSPPTGR